LRQQALNPGQTFGIPDDASVAAGQVTPSGTALSRARCLGDRRQRSPQYDDTVVLWAPLVWRL